MIFIVLCSPARAQEPRAVTSSAAEVEAVRVAAGPPGTPAERAARVAGLGREGLEALVFTPSLAPLAREVAPLVFEITPDAEVGPIVAEWLAAGDARFERALPLFPEAPGKSLAEPLLRFLVVEPEDEASPALARARLQAIIDRDGVGPIVQVLARVSTGAPGAPGAEGPLRAAIADVLGTSGRADAVGPLLDLLQARDAKGALDPDVRTAAARALGLLDDPGDRSETALLSVLAEIELEGDPMLRRAAIISLGRIRATAAVDPLAAILAGPDAGLRANALWSLREITGRDLGADAEAWRTAWEAERARESGEMPVILLELQSDDPAIEIAALRRSATFVASRERLRAPILRVLETGAAGVRASACATLGALRDRAAVDALVKALDDPDPGVWQAAWKALRGITGRELPARAEMWRRRR